MRKIKGHTTTPDLTVSINDITTATTPCRDLVQVRVNAMLTWKML